MKVTQGPSLLTRLGDGETEISFILTSQRAHIFPGFFATEASEQHEGEAREGSSGTRKGEGSVTWPPLWLAATFRLHPGHLVGEDGWGVREEGSLRRASE